ncbi:MAG: metallophosphoesterase family protein [Planctomycetes bacterium]|nr:metallophosphoesterase family protein [Planctomycetota bacterium]
MRLGILSDAHGNAALVRRALLLLDACGAEAFIICGDIGGLHVLEEFGGRRCWFVWGNTDSPDPTWRVQVESMGLPWPNGPLELRLDGKRIGVFHGNESEFAKAYKQAGLDYLLFGHTHRQHDGYAGEMRVINPGALHRVRVPTVALLDLATDNLEFIEVV